jgi:sec-independent protein translocase protein TatA
MADLGWPELLVIAVAVFVLFGWKHLPDAARSVGRSIRIFKSEVDEMHGGTRETAGPAAPAPSPAVTPPAVTTPTVTPPAAPPAE